MSNDRELAALWWEAHSAYRSGADHARRIREDDAVGLGHGQMAAMTRKGAARARAMGLDVPAPDAKATAKRHEPRGKAE